MLHRIVCMIFLLVLFETVHKWNFLCLFVFWQLCHRTACSSKSKFVLFTTVLLGSYDCSLFIWNAASLFYVVKNLTLFSTCNVKSGWLWRDIVISKSNSGVFFRILQSFSDETGSLVFGKHSFAAVVRWSPLFDHSNFLDDNAMLI